MKRSPAPKDEAPPKKEGDFRHISFVGPAALHSEPGRGAEGVAKPQIPSSMVGGIGVTVGLHLQGGKLFNRSRTFYTLATHLPRARAGGRYRRVLVQCTIEQFIRAVLPGLKYPLHRSKANNLEQFTIYPEAAV